MENIFELNNFIIYIFCVLFISLIITYINLFFVFKNNYKEKTSTYECGFEPFDRVISDFDIKFYLVALLFLLFDLELVFIIPWISCFNYLSTKAFLSIVIFLFLLVLGFYYEWKKGSLEWS